MTQYSTLSWLHCRQQWQDDLMDWACDSQELIDWVDYYGHPLACASITAASVACDLAPCQEHLHLFPSKTNVMSECMITDFPKTSAFVHRGSPRAPVATTLSLFKVLIAPYYRKLNKVCSVHVFCPHQLCFPSVFWVPCVLNLIYCGSFNCLPHAPLLHWHFLMNLLFLSP